MLGFVYSPLFGDYWEKKTAKIPLFISQKGFRLPVRYINETIKEMVEKTYGKEQAEKFKTKSLRDAYNDALLRANLTQEIKDTLFGHKRQGAREKYAISQATIIDAYNKAFQFLSVNHGTQARKDIEVMNQRLDEQSKALTGMLTDLKKDVETLKLKNFSLQFDMDTLKREIGDKGIDANKILDKYKSKQDDASEETQNS